MDFHCIFILIHLQSLQQSRSKQVELHCIPLCPLVGSLLRVLGVHQEHSEQKPGEHVSHSNEPTKSAVLVCSLRRARLIRRDSRNHSVCLAFMTE